jgi:glycerate kinase
MSIKTLFRKMQTDNNELNILQGFIYQGFETVRNLLEKKSAITQYNLTRNGAGNIELQHTLGRVPFGWSIIDKTDLVTVYRASWDANTIVFTVSGATTFSVEIW